MKKPKVKREIAIKSFYVKDDGRGGWIEFQANRDVIGEVFEYGFFHGPFDRDRYTLMVDARYDFNEVLEYFKYLEKEFSIPDESI